MQAMADLFEWIKSVGALAGLASAAFLIWDRLKRDRPHASLGSKARDVELRIENHGDADILIESIKLTPSSFHVALGSTIDDTADALYGPPWTTVVAAKDRGCFRLLTTPAWDALPATAPVRITISWSVERSRWIWQWPITLRTTVGQVRKLAAAKKQKPS